MRATALVVVSVLGVITLWLASFGCGKPPQTGEEYPVADYDPPVMLSYVRPRMPVGVARVEGGATVKVEVLVSVTGQVSSVRLGKSCGVPALDREAQRAALQNRYLPARCNDEPVEVWVSYAVEFVP